ncbi:MAG TPA: KH domain-containing protein [Acidobacteriaceae bacterium]|nr:KH domain-containing protein [Acidobacteriaceae bacterium]
MAKEEAAMVMCDLVRTMVLAMVDEPKAVNVSADMRNVERIAITVDVAPGDVGKVIGKQGRMARAMRTVMGAASIASGIPTSLDIRES